MTSSEKSHLPPPNPFDTAPPAYTEGDHHPPPGIGDGIEKSNPLDDDSLPPDYAPSSTNCEGSSSQIIPATHVFPPAFNGYYQWKFTRAFHLGPTSSDKQFQVRVHVGFRKPMIEIYDLRGGVEGEMVAKLERGNHSLMGTAMDVVIPHSDGRPERRVVLKIHEREFSMKTGGEKGSGGEEETFHWRNTRGSETKDLAGNGLSHGWKLVRGARKRTTVGEAFSAAIHDKEKEKGITSDGKEVVALAIWNSTWTWTKAFKFAFLGSGARGVLGADWERVVVTSAVYNWMNGAQQNGATGTAVAVAVS